jgi:hypothetical protein
MIMDTVANGSGRDASGRFVPGQSGNPAGKVPGTRNRKTVLMAALRDGEGEAAARVVIEKALAGDAVAARFVVALISPKPRGRTIHLDMPEDDDCNVVSAFNAALRALCSGEITPDEALQVSRFLDGRRKVLQAWQLEEKLTSYGRTIPGDPEWASSDDDDGDDEDEQGEDEDELEMTEAEAIAAAIHGMTPPADPARSEAAAAPAAAQSGSSSLQSACNSRSPEPLPDTLAIPGRFDAALVASVGRRLGAGLAPR